MCLDNLWIELVETLFFPTIIAYIETYPFISSSGETEGIIESGGGIIQSLTVTLNKGSIRNGDNSLAGSVSGNLDSVTMLNPDLTVGFFTDSPNEITQNITTSNYITSKGDNIWRLNTTNFAGSSQYNDNKGNAGIIPSIETEKSKLTLNSLTFNLSGRYKRFHLLRTQIAWDYKY